MVTAPLHSNRNRLRPGKETAPRRGLKHFRMPLLFGGGGLLLLLLAPGCGTAGYYAQAIRGHCQIVFRQKPIAKLIEDPRTSPALRQKFELLGRLKQFAKTALHLPVDGHYTRYADLDRPYVVWDIYAAPELSLKPKTWWYPVVGRLSYRGYFSEAGACRQARRLEKDGYEVYVGGVDAYSMLGWFKDPVLNTFINREETDLADLIFHELAHEKFFLRGDTDFNEAFAVTVAREGVRRWLAARPDGKPLADWEEKVRREDQFVELILKTRRELERIYGETDDEDPARTRILVQDDANAASKRKQKARSFQKLRRDYADLKRSWGGDPSFDPWFEGPVNNARLNAEATYYEWVPFFRRLFLEQHGDLDRFYERVRTLAKLPQKERYPALEEGEDGPSAEAGDENF
jgi:predicted aminopeptidase